MLTTCRSSFLKRFQCFASELAPALHCVYNLSDSRFYSAATVNKSGYLNSSVFICNVKQLHHTKYNYDRSVEKRRQSRPWFYLENPHGSCLLSSRAANNIDSPLVFAVTIDTYLLTSKFVGVKCCLCLQTKTLGKVDHCKLKSWNFGSFCCDEFFPLFFFICGNLDDTWYVSFDVDVFVGVSFDTQHEATPVIITYFCIYLRLTLFPAFAISGGFSR